MLAPVMTKPPRGYWGPAAHHLLLPYNKTSRGAIIPINASQRLANREKFTHVRPGYFTNNGSIVSASNTAGYCLRSSFSGSGGKSSSMIWTLPQLSASRFDREDWTLAVFGKFGGPYVHSNPGRWVSMWGDSAKLMFRTSSGTGNFFRVQFPSLTADFTITDAQASEWILSKPTPVVLTYNNPTVTVYYGPSGVSLGTVSSSQTFPDPNIGIQLNNSQVGESGMFSGDTNLIALMPRAWSSGEVASFCRDPFGLLWSPWFHSPGTIGCPEGFQNLQVSVSGQHDMSESVWAKQSAGEAVSGQDDWSESVSGASNVQVSVSGEHDLC